MAEPSYARVLIHWCVLNRKIKNEYGLETNELLMIHEYFRNLNGNLPPWMTFHATPLNGHFVLVSLWWINETDNKTRKFHDIMTKRTCQLTNICRKHQVSYAKL